MGENNANFSMHKKASRWNDSNEARCMGFKAIGWNLGVTKYTICCRKYSQPIMRLIVPFVPVYRRVTSCVPLLEFDPVKVICHLYITM